MATSTVRRMLIPSSALTPPAARAATSASGSTGTSTIKSLDGVRGLAILLILWCHLYWFSPLLGGSGATFGLLRFTALNAQVGVHLFFVLSGFLLFLPYARALVHPNRDQVPWPHPLLFWQRRVRRIFPCYLLVLVCIVSLMVAVAARQGPGLGAALTQLPWGQLLPSLFLLYDLHRAPFDLIAGVNPVLRQVDGPLWSLTVEWQFYLVLPLLAWSLSRLRSLRRVVLALLLLILVGLAIRSFATWVHYALGIADPADAPGLVGLACSLLFGIRGKFLELFALGMLASLFYVWAIEQQHWTQAQQRTLALTLMPLAGAGLLYCSLWATFASGRYEGPQAFYWPDASVHGGWAIDWAIAGDWTFGLCMLALVLIVLCLPRSWGKLFSLRPLTTLGLLSYSLYLWHMPIATLNARVGAPLPPLVLVGLILAWSVAIYWLVERPFLRYRRQLST
ncbi:MAG TPA: acyltransferase [Ktedonobacterales bacterium]